MNLKKVLKHPSKLVLIITALILIIVALKLKRWGNAEKEGTKVIDWDVVSYYDYLPATFIHQDLSLSFIDKDTINYSAKHQFWPSIAPNGGKVIKTTMGMSLLYAPFFFVAHLYALASPYYAPNGFSKPYEVALVFSSLFYLLIGLIFLRKVLLTLYNEWITSITLIVIVFGTNLYYYVTVEPAMSHAYSFSLIAVFIYLCYLWHRNQKMKYTVLLGLLSGLIVLIRPVNILILIIPFLYAVNSVKSLKTKLQFFWNKKTHLILMAFSAGMVILPQLIYWKNITGHWVFNSYIQERFYFLNPHVLEGLFSYRKGWYIYTPLMFLATIGLFIPAKKTKIKEYHFGLILFFILNIYVQFSWWSWWYGGGFGARSLIDSYPLMALPLSGFISLLYQKKFLAVIISLVLSFCIVLNIVQTKQKRLAIIHWDSMTKKAYWFVFFKMKSTPELIEKRNMLIIPPDYNSAIEGKDEYIWDL